MRMTKGRCGFLASVTNPAEAILAYKNGADIIDAKDPSRGALGALPLATVSAIKAIMPLQVAVSATIGDLPADPDAIVAATRAMARSGCDMIKIGFFPGGDATATITALGRLDLPGVRLVGLMLADQDPDYSLISVMEHAGFVGVMLDTAAKGDGTLTDYLSHDELSNFIEIARAANLFAGLAGSLRLSHVASLIRLKPHVLGFRGALCDTGDRTTPLSGQRVAQVRAAFDAVNPAQEPELAGEQR